MAFMTFQRGGLSEEEVAKLANDLIDTKTRPMIDEAIDNREPKEVVKEYVTYSVPGERTRDTTYTNDTGASIEVYARTTASTANTYLQGNINPGEANSAFVRSTTDDAAVRTRAIVSFSVPAGATYSVSQRDVENWVEYRKVA